MKSLLDTNVYLGACHSGQARARFEATFLRLLPATFLSAVVAYELGVNAQGRATRLLVQDFIRPLARTGRVVSPSFQDWLDAAEIVTAIHAKETTYRSKLTTLLNDVLIALSARRIGATLITHNRDDFRLIRRHCDFSLWVVEA